MTVYWQRRSTRAAGWARSLAAFAVILLILAFVSHYIGLLETPAFLWLLMLDAALVALVPVVAGYALYRVWTFGDLGARELAGAFLLILIPLIPYSAALFLIATTPRLTDIATDPEEPPAISAPRAPDMNPLSAVDPERVRQQQASYPEVTGRRYDLPFEVVDQAVNALIQSRGWPIFIPLTPGNVGAELTVEAVARSPLLAIPADVAIRLADEGGTTFVDMRSAWRYGSHDLGDNARRITGFLADLDRQLASRAGAQPEAAD